MNYGKAFRIIRATFGLNQADFSKLLGIGQSHVSLIEAGRRQPSRELIEGLADALRIPQPLIALLASEPKDLELQGKEQIEVLARSLLRLLVSASDEAVQRALPFPDDKETDK
jgi:transcriptional regulator with XRE-family HTH domain